MTLGYAPLSSGTLSETPVAYAAASTPQETADATSVSTAVTLGSVTLSGTGAATLTELSTTVTLGSVTAGASTVNAAASVTGLTTTVSLGLVMPFAYAGTSATIVAVEGLSCTLGDISDVVVQAWSFDDSDVLDGLWTPVPPVTATTV